MPRRIQHERGECQALVSWFHLQHPKKLIVHVPNELVRNMYQAVTQVGIGLVPGFPDYIILCARGEWHGLAIEMKANGKMGVVSAEQIAIIEKLNLEGYKAVCCRGFEEAQKIVADYMALGEVS